MSGARRFQLAYDALERHSLAITRKAVADHQPLIEIWHSALNLYLDKLKAFDTIQSRSEDEHFSLVTRFAFLSLGIGHSKAALDAACRGEYHHAAFSIRYMGELIIQGVYIRIKPSEARRWYRRYAGKETAAFAPSLDKTYTKVRDALAEQSEPGKQMMEVVREVMREADPWGAHPSQEVLEQIMSQSGDRLLLGSRYELNTCRVTLDRGLLMTLLLVEELYQDMVPGEDTQDLELRKSLWNERQRVMGFESDSPEPLS